MKKPTCAIEKGKAFNLKSLAVYSEASIVSRTLAENPSGTITLFAFDEGQGLSEHTAPYDAIVQVIEGKVEISIANKSHALKEGDIIVMPANVPHKLRAVEKFKMLLSMIKA